MLEGSQHGCSESQPALPRSHNIPHKFKENTAGVLNYTEQHNVTASELLLLLLKAHVTYIHTRVSYTCARVCMYT